MDYSKIITMEPGKRGGHPCVRGMRIAVSDVLGYLAGGMTEDGILREFPYLTRDDIRACLAFAADCVAMSGPRRFNERCRVPPPVGTATGGLLPGVDLTRFLGLSGDGDLEYIESMKHFK